MNQNLDYKKYLESKKEIDDKSLDKSVFNSLKNKLECETPQILELGSGIGTMIARTVEWNLLEKANYTMMDKNKNLTSHTISYLEKWSKNKNIKIKAKNPEHVLLKGNHENIKVNIITSKLSKFLENNNKKFDLVIANSFLDLVNIDETLEKILNTIKRNGMIYSSINFDGLTIFRPENKHNEKILKNYHNSMNKHGSCKSGRKLLERLLVRDVKIIKTGSSDWIVYPHKNGYSKNEKYFLQFLLSTIKNELEGRIDGDVLKNWIEQRKNQIKNKKLIYIAHQLDILGQKKDK